MSEGTVRKAAGATADGIEESQIIAAVRELGFSAVYYETPDQKAACSWLSECIKTGKPVIVYDGPADHWVSFVGMCGQKFIVINSSNTKENVIENGVRIVSKKEFNKKYFDRDGMFTGISIAKK